MSTPETLIAEQKALYTQIDEELKLYSSKMNTARNLADEAAANKHRLRADELTKEARAYTDRIMAAFIQASK